MWALAVLQMEERSVERSQAIGGHAPKLAQQCRAAQNESESWSAGIRTPSRLALSRPATRTPSRRTGRARREPSQQVERHGFDGVEVVHGSLERARPGDGREVVEPDLDADGAPAALLARERGAELLAEALQAPARAPRGRAGRGRRWSPATPTWPPVRSRSRARPRSAPEPPRCGPSRGPNHSVSCASGRRAEPGQAS